LTIPLECQIVGWRWMTRNKRAHRGSRRARRSAGRRSRDRAASVTKRSSNSRIWNEARTRIAISSSLCFARAAPRSLHRWRGPLPRSPSRRSRDFLARLVLGVQSLAEAARCARSGARRARYGASSGNCVQGDAFAPGSHVQSAGCCHLCTGQPIDRLSRRRPADVFLFPLRVAGEGWVRGTLRELTLWRILLA